MADKKISALDAATTPLAGTEVVPIVQSGATKKVSVDNLTAGKAVSALSVTATNLKTSNAVAGLDITDSGINATGSASDVSIPITPKGVGRVNIQKVATAGVIECLRLTNPQNANTTGDGVSIRFQNTSDPSQNRHARIESYSASTFGQSAGLRFLINNASDAPRTVLDLPGGTSGNVRVSEGNLVIGTSGKGIDFSATGQATGMTSELLDDYEEGTWTPTYVDSDGALVYDATGLTSGFYTKIGNTVVCQFHIQTFSITANGTGLLSLGGLPFTSRTLAQSFFSAGTLAIARVQDFASNNNPSSGLVGSAATTVLLYKYSSADARTSAGTRVSAVMATGNYDNELWGAIIYEAA